MTERLRDLVRLRRRQLLLALFALGATSRISSANASALPARLRELLSGFRKCPGLEADFDEEKNIVLLAAPLKSSGKVYFHPPHSLARIVGKPRRSHLVIKGRKIIIKEDNIRKEVDLSDKPALRGLISSLLHILAGNEDKLVADYETHFVEEGATGWRLGLVPREPSLKRLVRSLSFAGKELELSELRVEESSGDETITRFSNVNAKRRFSNTEIRKIFEI